ncbi:MAG TPA: transglycosylase SLT domain-containing protein, partial [Dehalococcoidia bacterium]|nr:transglycosylase SLT domain-containing protein [Dehalococcoidia bacterium]
DPQVGIMRRCPVRQFLEPGHDMSSSGYAYAAYYQHVEVAPMSNKERFEPLARRIAAEHAIDPDTFCRQIEQESGWDPNAVSPSGAEGLGQLVPRFYPNVNRRDPEANLRAAASSMRSYLDQFGGDYARALAAYNGGPVAIRRWVEHFGDG